MQAGENLKPLVWFVTGSKYKHGEEHSKCCQRRGIACTGRPKSRQAQFAIHQHIVPDNIYGTPTQRCKHAGHCSRKPLIKVTKDITAKYWKDAQRHDCKVAP